jgi:hypothetical protein
MPTTVIRQDPLGIETGGAAFPPAKPELSEQLFSQVGYVEDFDEPSMKLDTAFSIRRTESRL